MKILIQKCPDITAFLMDDSGNVIASEAGRTELEAIGRLVAVHPDKFHLSKVTGKHGPVSLD